MKKVLWYSDCLCPTGFGMVAENIIGRIKDDFDLEVLAINYNGEPYNKKDSPYYKFKDIPVSPALNGGDMFGRGKLLGMLKRGDYDTLFILQDLFNIVPIAKDLMELKKEKGFKFVFYFPIDGTFKKEWAEAFKPADVPVAYTHWGREQLGVDMKIIYHGYDKSFHKVDEKEAVDFRSSYFGVNERTFVVTNVNRNQPRKDLTKTIAAYKIFEKEVPNSILYLHCNWKDSAGIDLHDFIETHYQDLKGKIVCPTKLLSKDGLNMVYNSSDLLVSSTLGEGWGLSTIEAMACEVPVLIPDNTTATEILGDDRGYLIKSGSSPSLWVCNSFDNNIMRPVVDVEDMASKMVYIANNKQEAMERAARGKAWVEENCDWDKIAPSWAEIL